MTSLYHVLLFRVPVLNYCLKIRVFLPIHYVSLTCLSFRAIMDLTQHFDGVTCDKTFSVSELDINRKYRILKAERLITRFGPTVILNVNGEYAASVKIFLPRRYSDVFTDTDIERINSNAVFLHLFKGVCPTTNAYLLSIKV